MEYNANQYQLKYLTFIDYTLCFVHILTITQLPICFPLLLQNE